MLRRSFIHAFALGLLLVPSLSACSSDPAEGEDPSAKVGEIRQNQTWKTGDRIIGVVSIFEGATVEIEPGATIGCTAAAKIQVGGTLRVKGGDGSHATISCPQWTGISAVVNGQLQLDGLDLENAQSAVELTTGARDASFSNGTIKASVRPFTVAAGTTLKVTDVKVTTPTSVGEFDVSVSHVSGTLVARRLDYDAGGNEGLMALRGGSVDIEDSTLKATSHDLVSSYGGKSMKVRYSTMKGAHCGAHVDASKDSDRVPTESFELDHVTSENLFGITIYAVGGAGPYSVKDSNFKGAVSWLDLKSDPSVALSFVNVWTEGNQDSPNGPPKELKISAARIEAAQPR